MKKIVLALIIMSSPLAALAADGAAKCTADNVGVTQCMGQKQCECKFFRKSEMAGTPDRFGWDCGIEQPNCDSGASVTQPGTPYNGPSSVGYGVSTSTTNMTQSPTTTNTQAQAPVLTQQQQSPTTTNTTANTTTTTQTPTQNNTQTH